jgi:hypothetical protein
VETTLQVITIILAIIGLVAPPIGLYLRSKGKKEAADMVDAIGGGVDKAKLMLSNEQAKAMTHAIKAKAEEKGVLGALDAILAAAGHNAKTRDELIDSTPE